jgi:hypothetical protein
MKRVMIRTLLFASGAMLLGIGMAVLFQPITFFAANGATLGTEPSLMSEVRSPGGLLITSGIIVLLGAVRRTLTELALMLSTLVYGTYGASRLVSMVFDGVPSTSVVAATGIEIFVGILSLVVLLGHGTVQSRTTARS